MARAFLGFVLVCLFAGCAGNGATASSDARKPATTATATATGPYPETLYRVPGGSMEPTLGVGTRILIRHSPIPLKLDGETLWPKPGWIAVFHPPEGAESEECGPRRHVVKPGGAACDVALHGRSTVELVKRIVAGRGEEMYVKEGHVFRRAHGGGPFVRENDSYIKDCGASPECNFPTPIRIPAGQWFMVGDNRGESDDSRAFGPIPSAWIVGFLAGIVQQTTPEGTTP
jgi:signal peptidase I